MGFCGCIANFLGGFYKYLVFIFNILFVLAGATLLTLGILIEIKVLDLSDYTSINIHTSAIILMVGGGLVVFISFLGCCGAISNNRCLLNLYACMLLLAFCLQLAGSIVVFVQNPEIIADLETDMKNMMTNYPLPPFEGETGESAANAKKFWDTTQKLFKCCGIRSKIDWSVYKPGLIGLPDSCQCEDDFYSYNCDSEGFYQNGCYYRLKNAIFDMHYIMAWVAIGVAGMELIFGILTLIYANTNRKKSQKV